MKATTNNEYNKAVNKSIDFINEHLNESFGLKKRQKLQVFQSFIFIDFFKPMLERLLGHTSHACDLKMQHKSYRLQF